MDEAIQMLETDGQRLDRLRVRAFPFHSSVTSFISDHDFVFVVEQNHDSQLRSLIVNECGIDIQCGWCRSCTTMARRSQHASSLAPLANISPHSR